MGLNDQVVRTIFVWSDNSPVVSG